MKAFLSHSSFDKERFVRPIANLLGKSRCVFDERTFEAGYPTLQEIFRTLDESDLFVLFISRKALASAWVKKEIKRAKENLQEGELLRFLPIIIDDGITHESAEIPDWMKKSYNLKRIQNPTIIYNKIDMALKSLAIETNPINRKLTQIFVGRNNEIEDFENDINNIEGWVPRFIVAHSFYEGMGRRTFLKQAMIKTNLVRAPFIPRIINMEHNESIEHFIMKSILITPDKYVGVDFFTIPYKDKISYAIEILRESVENNESIFIADNGSIVHPNGMIADWFRQIIQSSKYGNELVCCLLSKYRPITKNAKVINCGLSYDIKELSKKETQSLFMQMLRVLGINLSSADSQFFLDYLKGIPNQVKYAVNAIANNQYEAKKNIKDIAQYADEYSRLIVENIQRDEKKFQILLLLSEVDIINQTFVYKLFSDNDLVTETLADFYNLSIIDLYYDRQYIRLSPTISDYIDRCRYTLKPNFKTKLTQIIKAEYSNDLEAMLENDYSQFLITLKSMVENRQKIPAKYYIPSLMLKNIIREYDRGNYKTVIDMCTALIENKNSDASIIRELTYYLELSYARTQKPQFYDYIDSFDGMDRHFLLGFYYRNMGGRSEQQKARKEFENILEEAPTNKKAKRELVNTLLSLEEYDQALEYARDNYEADKTNAFHIQSYFAALIRRDKLEESDLLIIDDLLDILRNRRDRRSKDFFICMNGEYQYYIKHDYERSIKILKEAKVENGNVEYVNKAIKRIERDYSSKRNNTKIL